MRREEASMFEKEEKKLHELKKEYANVEIPKEIDDYIRSGIRKGKKSTPQPFWRIGMVAASILLIIFLTTIRISPGFANYVSTIPGMERIVELIRHNKGIMSAVENDYLQEVGITKEEDGVSLTIDAIIMDEAQMLIFYTIESDHNYPTINLSNIKLKSQTGEELDVDGLSYGSHGEVMKGEKVSGQIKIIYSDKEVIPEKFNFETGVNINEVEIIKGLNFPIEVDTQKFSAITNGIAIDKSVEAGEQSIYFEKMEIHPTRIALFLEYDESNTHEIFRFDDIALEDEKGNRWISDGSSSMEDNKIVIYFESNYFSEPQQLDLVFSSFTALPKDELEVVVDLEKESIIKAPSDKRLKKVWLDDGEKDRKGIYFQIEVDPKDHNYFFSLFNNNIIDANGTVHEYTTRTYSNIDGTNLYEQGLIVDTDKIVSPITLKIAEYPARIKEKVKVKIK
ncbi:DUF4179 domain-containing protein [Sutcliffiella horikoshii]|uniref:DUF4179 domain-containing protein n=2 Tax=Sutcliffiella horikoshii TaxID=79883 RepID=A0A5D4TDR3_9BACI|nr:DUF4179 domain-containing protein [Sutcliffiella horikoshii]